jgi:hypothetical protein
MPRAEADSSCGGLRVPALYEALLAREREHHYRYGETVVHEGRELQVVWADPNNHAAGCFCRPRHMLDALEAGQPVVVRGHDLGGWDIPKVPLSAEQKDWPNWYTVTLDDRIVPAEYPVVDPIRPPRASANDHDE